MKTITVVDVLENHIRLAKNLLTYNELTDDTKRELRNGIRRARYHIKKYKSTHHE